MSEAGRTVLALHLRNLPPRTVSPLTNRPLTNIPSHHAAKKTSRYHNPISPSVITMLKAHTDAITTHCNGFVARYFATPTMLLLMIKFTSSIMHATRAQSSPKLVSGLMLNEETTANRPAEQALAESEGRNADIFERPHL